MKNTYETMILLDNREVKRGWQALKESVVGLFKKHDAEVVSARRWGERQLEFPIENQRRGTYLLLYHKAPTEQLAGIYRELEYAESVFRHLTLACEEIPAEAYEPEAAFDESAVGVEEADRSASRRPRAPDRDAGKGSDDAAETEDAKAAKEPKGKAPKGRKAKADADAADDEVVLDDGDDDAEEKE